ncbi:mannose-specific lectin 2-like [Dioscorea cayenensis subsp. rotundata]|uniref:Mannose-specific lectin 2-like n=1 Tax=Dioscorea cayennensis subsp. rotundata TaxID=55577 RepID=A0AB40C1X8_DIOCR|nr:mannose-specific lectin 2-like [Dioscorea cayenensis subsp. rotundata]
MAHHHLLPFLALILLILPSSSQAQQQPTALFSDTSGYLGSNYNITISNHTLSLTHDCGLYYYDQYDNGSSKVIDFNTPTDEEGCYLTINNFGQLVIKYSNERKKPVTLGTAGKYGTYALLTTKYGIGIFGPRLWDNKIKPEDPQTPKNKNLRAAHSSIVLYSPDDKSRNANDNNSLAINGDVSVYITRYCALSVNHMTTGINIWNSNSSSAEPRICSLYLTRRGVLPLLYYDESNELHTQWTGGALAELKKYYVLVLRYYGGLDIYGVSINVRNIPPYSGPVTENIKMVTA